MSMPPPHVSISITEHDQANNLIATYIGSQASSPAESKPSPPQARRIDVSRPKHARNYVKQIVTAFLPAGYPHSVTSDYLEYQIYDSLQAFSSSIANMLSSRALLEGLGVGDPTSTPHNALLLTVLLDTFGRLSTILFAHHYGLSLSPECKTYRFLADIFNDISILLDCLSPAMPGELRIAVLVVGRVMSSLCGVTAGSAKASLSAHFVTGSGTLGEVEAKDSSQETIISLLGMLAGTAVISVLTSRWTTWTALIILLSIHLGTNYLAVRAVCMTTLNRQRASILFTHLLDQSTNETKENERNRSEKTEAVISNLKVLSPQDVAQQERIFEIPAVLRWKGGRVLGYAYIGASLSSILSSLQAPEPSSGSYKTASSSTESTVQLDDLLHVYKEVAYLTWYDEPSQTFSIVLKSSITPATTASHGEDNSIKLEAWMHALVCARAFATRTSHQRRASQHEILTQLKRSLHLVRDTVRKHGFWDEGGLLARRGWDLHSAALEVKSGVRIVVADVDTVIHDEDRERAEKSAMREL